MTTDAGSALSIGGISMTPAPTRLRRLVRLVVVDPLRVVRRDTSTRPDIRPDTGDGAVPPDTAPAAPGDGAMPHVSQ
jgi:hypothetical protein